MNNLKVVVLLALVILFSHCSDKQSYDAGKELPVLKNLQIGPCMDAAVDQNILYVIGSHTIYSFDISSPKDPMLLGQLSGLGNVRQIEVQGGFAYVTSREEGLSIIDITNPNKMVKVAHYDTLELGTGIAVSGSVAAVANRQYGVEFINISNPEDPVILGMVRTGEAQSVFIKDTLAVAGDWGSREVVLIDISNPRDPKIISRIELDGYGDGVFVKGNLCYAATGHHARGYSRNNADSIYWGKGHGMEIIDISNPQHPEKLSVIKLPVRFHQMYADMWDVQVIDNYAFVGDSEAGLFIVDVSDPHHPFFIGHATIPVVEMPEYMNSDFTGKKKSGPVGGFAIGDGVVYIAGKMSDLYVISAKRLAKPIPVKRSSQTINLYIENGNSASPSEYLPQGQVHAVFMHEQEGKAFIAAGNGGVHEVQLIPEISGKQLLKTGTIIFDVYYRDDKLYIAEGTGGFSVWKYDLNSTPEIIGRYKPENEGVYQLLIDSDHKYAYLHVGANTLEIVDISDLENIKRITFDRPDSGLLYRFPIARGFLNNRFVASSWHTSGANFYEVNRNEGAKLLGKGFPPLGVINGVAFLKDKSLAIYQGGYVIQNPPDKTQLEIKDPIRIENIVLQGKPTIFGSRMYVSNRMKGIVTAVDISDLKSPKKVWQLALSGNPGLVVEYKDMVIIPDGHSGLQLFNNTDGAPYYKGD